MNKTQWIVIAIAAILFFGLYFGFDTNPSGQKAIEEKRSLAAVSTDVNSLIVEAKKSLDPQQKGSLAILSTELESATSDSARVELLKQLSSNWYKFEKIGVAGHYAEEVAKITQTEEAWSIAGTTYSICVQREQEKKVKDYCTERAISSLETAASLRPDEIQHKINLALVHTANPPQDNPMQGILMLVELNKQYPENVSVLVQLGRLAIKTGQFEKAVERLGKAVELEPENRNANCMLAQAFEGKGDNDQAASFSQKCQELSER